MSVRAVEYTDCTSAEGLDSSSQRMSWNDTKLHLMLRLLSRNFGECWVAFHCHYSHIHSETEGLYSLGSHLWGTNKIILPFSCVQKITDVKLNYLCYIAILKTL